MEMNPLIRRTQSFRIVWTLWTLIVALGALETLIHAQSLVAHNATWRYRKGTSANPTGWKTEADANLDASWLTGTGGFGYADNANETSLCGTILSDMDTKYATVAMRKSFTITTDPDPTLHLQLTADFDDGFIAWLDGNYLASFNSPGAPNEPAFNATATAGHESSHGNSGPQPPEVYDLGAVGSRLSPGTHVLAVMGLNSSLSGSSDFVQVMSLDLVSAPVGGDITWKLADSPITVSTNVNIANGSTLTIEPGVVVKLASGINITVANGGRLLAEGNETNRIRFTQAGTARWGGIVINGAGDSPETRITYADIDGNGTTAIHSSGGTLFLDYLTFGSTDHQYVSLDGSSFVVSHCHFPAPTSGFEPGHGNGGIKPGGHGIFRRNYFGGTIGYNDVVDFTGGNRPAPIVHFINNVIESGQDDGWDLDGTDAWVEGNIFLHQHRNGNTPDSSSSISGGNFGNDVSDITIVGNLFFDCDNAATAKQGNFFALVNNTIVHMTNQGGIDGDTSAVCVEDTTPSPTTWARGMYLEGNIVHDVKQLVRNYDVTQTTVTWVDNLIPMAWSGPGTDNEVVADPLLAHIPTVSEAVFGNWQEAQIVRQWFSLQAGSPAVGTGPDGRDKGGVIPIGVVVSGEPTGTTTNKDATLHVGGFHRTGFAMPTTGWPEGMGYTHYKWRLDGGAWSAETPIDTPINLTALADGAHYVEVTGKRDSGLYQDDPLLGEDALVTKSATWTVQSSTTPAPLEIGAVVPQQDGSVSMTFNAEAGKSYSLLERDAFDAAHPWTKVASTPVENASGPVTLSDPNASGSALRFYEIVSPAVP